MTRAKKKPLQVYLTEDMRAFVATQAGKLDVPMTYYIAGLINAEKRKQGRRK
jgi:hypothetical protein